MSSESEPSKLVWLDVDPGHDDATAILLAVHAQNIQLLGLSSTHGNAPSDLTSINAARCLEAFHAPDNIQVYPGASKPLLRPAKHDPEIHGPDGLGGVEGLPPSDHPKVLARIARNPGDNQVIHAVEGMASHIKHAWTVLHKKTVIVSTGPMTNVALFASLYPTLISESIDEIVFMGGGVGLGNRGAVAEYNILCDPHASQIVLDTPVRTVMVPINVTHTAIVTKDVHSRILSGNSPTSPDSLPPPLTPLRHTLSTVISFFAESYKSTFGFLDGPPLHDALAVAYVARPDLFDTKRYRVDVELTGQHSLGETVVDVWNYQQCDDSWGVGGKNCLVAEKLRVGEFWDFFLSCIQ